MPNIHNFSEFDIVKTTVVNPLGWINPITIEYAIGEWGVRTCFWRIKNTTHTFTIPVNRLDYLCGGDYSNHFTEVLQNFLYDYIEWKQSDFQLDWMKEYRNEYNRYIL